jgi:hypothetical protein
MNTYKQTKKSYGLAGRELHIHVDAMVRPSKHFEAVLIEELKFKEHHFEHNLDPAGLNRPHYEPQAHFSAYPKNMDEFRSLWTKALSLAKSEGVIGYLEGEYVCPILSPENSQVSFKVVAPHFRLALRPLTTAEKFRKTEIHFTTPSSSPLVDLFYDSGFFGAQLKKDWGLQTVLTAQGSIENIQRIVGELLHHFCFNGFPPQSWLFEERIIRHALLGIESFQLPPVVERIIQVNSK